MGITCPLTEIIGHIAEGASRVRTLDTELAALQGRVTQLESDAMEWCRDNIYLDSVKHPCQPGVGEE